MGKKIKVATVSTKYCRETGKELSSEVIKIEERDEKEFYAPLVEIFGEMVLKEFKEKQKKKREVSYEAKI